MTPATEAGRLIAASGRSQRAVAEFLSSRVGRQIEHYHVSRMVKGQRKVAADEMDALRELAGEPTERAKSHIAPSLTLTSEALPLYGAGGVGEPLRLDDKNRVGSVRIHPSQEGSVGAFAFVMPDDTMGDRLRRGEIGHVLRNRHPLQGLPCLIEMADGSALCRIYDGQDERTLFVQTLQPKAKAMLALKDVVAVHALGGVSYGGV